MLHVIIELLCLWATFVWKNVALPGLGTLPYLFVILWRLLMAYAGPFDDLWLVIFPRPYRRLSKFLHGIIYLL